MLTRWLPWKTIIKRTAKAYGFIDPISLMARLRRFAQPSEVQEPIELIRAGILFHARGLINTKAIQHNLDWIWPFWVQRQFNPSDVSFIPRSFSVSHVNLTHRNWTAVGLPDVDAYPIVDPRGLVTPYHDSWSIDFWVVDDAGHELYPSKLASVEQELLLEPNLTIVTRAEDQGLSLTSRVQAQDHDDPHLSVKVQATAPVRGWLVVALRPYNPEGIQFIEKLSTSAGRSCLQINTRHRLEFSTPPDRTVFSDYAEGDVVHRLWADQPAFGATCKVGMATGAALFSIPDGEKGRTVTLRLNLSESPSAAGPSSQTWTQALESAAELSIPDPWMQHLYDSAVRTLILLSAGEIVPGPYTYKRFWFRDACLMLNALLALGLDARAARQLNSFLPNQRVTGYFHSQEGEWDANGEVLWILDRFQQLSTRRLSPDWSKAAYRAAKWIWHKRVRTDASRLHSGLLPPGFSAEHLGPVDYYYWDNFWCLGGLRSARRIMARFQASEATLSRIDREADDLEKTIFTSIANIPEHRSRGGIPASPYRRLDAGAIGSLAADYPLQITPPGDSLIQSTLSFLLRECMHRNGFFQDMIHSGINPYLTLHLAQVQLRSGDLTCLDLIRTVADLASPTGQWPEAVHPLTLGGCMGDGQHGWAAAEWVMMIRNMFVREEGRELIIGSGLFPEWIQSGQPMHFGPTLTPYGQVSVDIRPEPDQVRLKVDLQGREMPERITARLPGWPVQAVQPNQTILLDRGDA